jgi:enoyl-CoA hydratase/carnithine racemase
MPIHYDVDDHVVTISIDRPARRNALDLEHFDALADAWKRFRDDPDAWVAILTGAGERAFCAGGDLKERNGMSDAAWRAQHEIFERAFISIVECPLPVIAAVNGHAFGGGLEMALCCDFAYAVPEARLALSEVSLGIMPGGMGTQTLPRAVGERRAKELILTARAFSAAEALQWGVINRICELTDLLGEALGTAQAIAANAPLSVRQAKKSIHNGLPMDLLAGYRYEIEAYNHLVDTEDRREGVKAFNEKRKPRFAGR